MPTTDALEAQIAQWRQFLRRRRADGRDVEELEDQLRRQVARLTDGGLTADEAFVVAVMRLVPAEAPEGASAARADAAVAIGLAVAAALTMKIPALFGYDFSDPRLFYMRNASLLVLPYLGLYFAWKRRLTVRLLLGLGAAFAAAAVFANIYPFALDSHTGVLTALHLPIALWLAIGVAYVAGRWFAGQGRMDFVRFSGELFIYFVLIGLGGMVFIGFTMLLFGVIGVNAEPIVERWLLPCGVAGAVLIASWLVEAKQSVIENMAPVLTRVFTPVFTLLLLAFLGTMAWTGNPIDVGREVLIAFDLLLVLVVGLVLYAASARDPDAPPDLFDRLQLVLVVSALLVDVLALAAIASRISEFGFTPNRVAALGENLILLANLAWTTVLYVRFLAGRGRFAAIEGWQVQYLPVYSAWAAFVVVAFPPLFSYI